MITAAAHGASAGTVAAIIFGVIAALALWLLPIIVAVGRKVPSIGSIVVIDLLLGWTLIGWVVALAMAFRSVYRISITDERMR